jgi:hypothetical protein|tara:strand:- start:5026 stop:5160 length:135 start_codon:yes stop_codon:yes gene_type:complete
MGLSDCSGEKGAEMSSGPTLLKNPLRSPLEVASKAEFAFFAGEL